MKDTKRRFEWFSFYDHTGIEQHLEEMAAQGWLLERIGGFTWHYRRTGPKKLAFSVSYFSGASQFDPGPSPEQEAFYDLCAHAGWTLAAASAQMQIFYNEQENPVPIDTDPELEVEAIHRSAKRSWLPSQILLLAVAVINGLMNLFRVVDAPIVTLSSSLILFSCLCWPLVILMTGVDMATYLRWRRRALKAAAQGEFLATRSHPLLQKLALAVVLAGLAWCMAYLRGGMLTVTVTMLICMFGLVFAIAQVRELLKRKRVSAGANLAVTVGACVALPLLTVTLVTALVLTVGGGGQDSGGLPLTLPELLELPDEGDYVCYQNFSQSPLLELVSANQQLEGDRRGMNYGVTVVKLPMLYDLCRDSYLRQWDGDGFWNRSYVPVGAAPWGAVEAYQEYDAVYGPEESYLLCYPDRIVSIGFDWEPTQPQMALVGEKLGGR